MRFLGESCLQSDHISLNFSKTIVVSIFYCFGKNLDISIRSLRESGKRQNQNLHNYTPSIFWRQSTFKN